jgi:hypothetical protein
MGTSDYYSSDIALWGGQWAKEKGYSHRISNKKRELDKSFKPNQIRAKGIPPEKNTTIKKQLLTQSPGNVAEGS